MEATSTYERKTHSTRMQRGIMERKRDQSGQFSEEMSADRLLDVFRDRYDQAKPITAGDINEEFDWSRRTIHTKLNELSGEDGPLESRQVGARAKVWWVPISRDDAPLTQMGLAQTELPSTTDEILEYVHMSDMIDESTRQQRAEAILTAYQFLQEKKRATNKQIRQYTHQRHDFDSATEQQTSEQRQWVLYLRDGLKELPGVEPPGTSRGKMWNFIDPDGDLAKELDIEVDHWIHNLETDIVGNETSIKRQKALIQKAYDYLKQEGEARKGEFEDHLPNYTAHYTDFSGFWSYTLRDALSEPSDVEAPDSGAGSWTFRYVGD